MNRGTGPRGRTAVAVLVTALVLAPARARDGGDAGGAPPASGLPVAQLEALRDVAYSLSKKKREADTRDVLAFLRTVGDDAGALEKLSGRCEKALALKRKGDDDVADEIAAISGAAAAFGRALDGVLEDRRKPVAEAILALDGSVPEAHRVVGHVPFGDGYVEASQVRLLERRSEIEQAFQQARQMEVPTELGESFVAPLSDVYGEKGHYVRWRTVTIHSKTFAPERLKRVLEESVRAYAFSTYLRTGRLWAPPPHPVAWVVWSSKTDHRKGLDAAEKAGGISALEAERSRERDGDSWLDSRGFYVANVYVEVDLECVVFRNLWMWRFHKDHEAWSDDDVQPCLLLGHLNWISERFLGGRIPGWDWYEDPQRGRTSDEMDPERRRLLRLAKSGVAGVRTYMRHLAAKGQDPAWTRSFVENAGELAGEDLLKSMLVCEYLQERGTFTHVLLSTLKKTATQETFEAALGKPMLEFEQDWRDWLLAGEAAPSLVDRMSGRGSGGAEIAPSATQAVDVLNDLRRMTLPHADAVEIEPTLAKGCEGHARYLAKNPDQAAAWPAAHEEYVDRPGYSPEGVRAAATSVIAPGVRSARQAVEGWMATFYHRLPLLDPGLLRIGWGFEENVAVLDSASMVEPTDAPTLVVWPPHLGKGMPRRFAPELPSPKPGEDQSRWGYPVTVQTFGEWEGLGELTVTLHAGGAGGPEVPCIVSTPAEPSNPVIAPGGAWCLVPKAHLEPNAQYTIVIEGLPKEPETRSTHTFTTGP